MGDFFQKEFIIISTFTDQDCPVSSLPEYGAQIKISRMPQQLFDVKGGPTDTIARTLLHNDF
jgi:hypothetical protein